MKLNIHFISGLPRSGSTLLAAILRQNPIFRASVQSPIADIFSGLLKSMSSPDASAVFISNKQRETILRSLFEAYYSECGDEAIIFDNNRYWCVALPTLKVLFPTARLICLVRSSAWILDSMERLVRRNALRLFKIFNFDPTLNVYQRAQHLMGDHMVGPSIRAFRQAWFSEESRHLVVIRYNSLAERPAEVIRRLYQELDQPRFLHDFTNIDYEEAEFDARLGLPGLHRVRSPIKMEPRETILPPDLFSQHDNSFWEVPNNNPRGVVRL